MLICLYGEMRDALWLQHGLSGSVARCAPGCGFPAGRLRVATILLQHAFVGLQRFCQKSRRKLAENFVDLSSSMAVGRASAGDGSAHRMGNAARQIASPRASAAALRIAGMLVL